MLSKKQLIKAKLPTRIKLTPSRHPQTVVAAKDFRFFGRNLKRIKLEGITVAKPAATTSAG